MISYHYLFILTIFLVFLAESAFGLGPYKDNGETILDQTTGLEWQKRDSSNYTNLTWANALAYCEDSTVAGYDDWRLPNKLELRSIVEHSKIDPPVIDNVFDCQSSWYWSSTSFSFIQDPRPSAWVVNFRNGEDDVAQKSLSNEEVLTYARCVRTAPLPKEPSKLLSLYLAAILGTIEELPDTGQTKCYDNYREISCPNKDEESSFYGQDGQYHGSQPSYRKNKNFTITDLNTKLIWQQNTADLDHNGVINGADKRVWQDAVDYCAELSFASNSDWRLPTKYEIQSIVDYGITDPKDEQPTIDSTFSAQSSAYWSATTLANDGNRAWVIYFDNGNDYRGGKTDKHYIRCVHGNSIRTPAEVISPVEYPIFTEKK